MIKILCFHCRVHKFNFGQKTKIPHAAPGAKKKKKHFFFNLKKQVELLRQAVVKGLSLSPGLDVAPAEFSPHCYKIECCLGVLPLSQSCTEEGRADPVETPKEETFPQVTVRPNV